MPKLEALVIAIVTGKELSRHPIIAAGRPDIETAVAAARNKVVETVAGRPQDPLLILAAVAAKLLNYGSVVAIVALDVETFAAVAGLNRIHVIIIIIARGTVPAAISLADVVVGSESLAIGRGY